MARCNDCNKFVSFGDLDVSDVTVEIVEDQVSMTGTVYRPCADCGNNLKSTEVESVADLEEAFLQEGIRDSDKVEYELEDEFPEIRENSRTQDVDRKGRKILSPRYMKTFIGVECDLVITRKVTRDGKEVKKDTTEINLSWEEAASAFDEC